MEFRRFLHAIVFAKAEVGEAVAIGLADEQICPLHYALPLLKALDFIDELFSCVRIIRKDRPVGF